MNAAEHEISTLLDRAYHFTYGDGADPRTGNALATEAVGRGLLALIPLVREIGDQLDTLPRGDAPLATKDEQWAVVAQWANSAPTVHGPFPSVAGAHQWGIDNLNPDDACEAWDAHLMQDGDR
jgi:hypothetical protein